VTEPRAGDAGIRVFKGAVRVDVEVKVRASRTKLLGMKAERLVVALAAPPVDGAANEALRRALAEHFGLPLKSVNIVAGEKSRRKVVELSGVSLEQVLAGLPKA
jgi:uncharacterized protein (TIGR00251 family)